MNNYEDLICEAINTIVQDAISKANYDRTIQATIISCEDELTGKYKVRYQNSSFYAYSNSLENKYYKDTDVFILIPDNDFSNTKTILGSVNKMAADTINIEEKESDVYRNIGTNLVLGGTSTLELSSYKEKQIDLYNKEKNINLINLDVNLAKTYLSASTSFVIGAEFKTSFVNEQKVKGNYGIGIEIAFKNAENTNTIIKKYLLDVNQFNGQPYNLTTFTKQQSYFDLDGANFEYINRIYIFDYGFPLEDNESEIKDISIKNIVINGTYLIWSDISDSYLLNIKTPNGSTFTIIDDDNFELTFEAEVLYKGRKIQSMVDIVDFYWFEENNAITPANQFYNSFGGSGWMCLNSYTEKDDIITWLPADEYISIKKKTVNCRNKRYKCVGVYNDKPIVFEYCYFYNSSPKYQIDISSTNGTQFQYNLGITDLTCSLTGNEEDDEISYIWSVEYKDDVSIIEETEDLNDEYEDTLSDYLELLEKIENEETLKAKEQLNLDKYKADLDVLNEKTRVKENNIINLLVETLENVSDYKCSVLVNGELIGTQSIRLYNYKEDKYEFGLTIENGEQVFVYDENGISPCSPTKATKQSTKELSFTIVDVNGNKITNEQKNSCSITWRVPSKKSLIYISSSVQPTRQNVNGYNEYDNLTSLNFLINNNYNLDYSNNQIELIVKYGDLILRKFTNMIFVKEGVMGTTGSDVYCLTRPKLRSSETRETPYLLTFRLDENKKEWNINSIYINNNSMMKFYTEIWDKGVKIEEAESSAELLKSASVKGILQEKSCFKIYSNDENSIQYNTSLTTEELEEGFFANILKTTSEYNNLNYYSFYPLGFLYFNPSLAAGESAKYNVELVKDSGFLFCEYDQNGEKPSYSSNLPFEIKVTKMIDGYVEDISTLTKEEYSLSYTWDVIGKVYRSNGWENKTLLTHLEDTSLNKNQAWFKPSDTYNGECVTAAIRCTITKDIDNQDLCYLHIPIVMHMNKFSNSNINDWDGISLSLNENGGAVLAPQVGAGRKNNAGEFSGILMGTVKEYQSASPRQGLYGYRNGERTFRLSADTGSAIFGTSSSGQIIINPASDAAYIYSNNYWKEYNEDGTPLSYNETNKNGQGMLIDLSTPSIKWGNGNFSVDENGNLKAINADITGKITATSGEIGGFELTSNKLSNKKLENSIYKWGYLDENLFYGYMTVEQTQLESDNIPTSAKILYDLNADYVVNNIDYNLQQNSDILYLTNKEFTIIPENNTNVFTLSATLKNVNTDRSCSLKTTIDYSGVSTSQIETESIFIGSNSSYARAGVVDRTFLTKNRLEMKENTFHNLNYDFNYSMVLTPSSLTFLYKQGSTTTHISPNGITTPSVTQTSLAEIKTDISNIKYNRNIFDNSSIYQYKLKTDEKQGKLRYGFVIGDNYNTPIEVLDKNKEGINLYSMCALMWAEIQNLRKEIKGDK